MVANLPRYMVYKRTIHDVACTDAEAQAAFSVGNEQSAGVCGCGFAGMSSFSVLATDDPIPPLATNAKLAYASGSTALCKRCNAG